MLTDSLAQGAERVAWSPHAIGSFHLSGGNEGSMECFLNPPALEGVLPEHIPYKYLKRGEVSEDKVWLSSTFRVRLIQRGIEKAGSINQLGRVLGYRSRVHPGWSVRQILVGKQPFPSDRLRSLAEYLDQSMEDIMKHRIRPDAVTKDGTKRALETLGMHYYVDP